MWMLKNVYGTTLLVPEHNKAYYALVEKKKNYPALRHKRKIVGSVRPVPDVHMLYGMPRVLGILRLVNGLSFETNTCYGLTDIAF